MLHGSFSSAGGELLLLKLLLRDLLLLGLVLGGVGLLLLNQGHLDVAGGGHVGVDPTVGTVRTPAHLGGTLNLQRK